MMRNLRVALSAAVLLMALCAACSRTSDPLTATDVQCVPRGLRADGLPSEWQAFADHIHACVVLDPAGVPALEIIAVSAISSHEQRSEPSKRVDMPRPLILLPGGTAVGRLPYNYPDDPPATTRLQFSAWRNAIPERIEIRLRDPTVSGDRAVVLLWNAERREYLAAVK
jgi:hypothetical protein